MVIRFAPTEAGRWDFHLISNVSELNDKTGSVTAADSESPGFVTAANVHHWAYTEIQKSNGGPKPHLWMGAAAPRFASLDDAAFHSLVDARAAQKFNHLSGWIVGGDPNAYAGPDAPNLDYFRKLDERVRYLNQKGITADLVLAGGEGTVTKLFPQAAQRRRFVRYAVARYTAMNVTWQAWTRSRIIPTRALCSKRSAAKLRSLTAIAIRARRARTSLHRRCWTMAGWISRHTETRTTTSAPSSISFTPSHL